jgi:hypothetical protein
MLKHGFAPVGFLNCTIIPIVKNKRKSLYKSDNYRGVALSSICGKLMDRTLLNKCQSEFETSDLQFGFKPGHSTTHCTFVVDEVVNYYLNRNTDVHAVLLDASKAFDRVHFGKLFKLLLKRNTCPSVVRVIMSLYTNKNMKVKWGNNISESFSVCNGVTIYQRVCLYVMG